MNMKDYVAKSTMRDAERWDPWSAPVDPATLTITRPISAHIPTPVLTEEHVREIVRDELTKIAAKALTSG